MTIKHLKVSAKADGPDPGNVHASDWNAIHDLSALVIADITDSGLTGQALVRTNTVAGALTQLTIPNHNLMAVTAGGKVTIGADPVNPLDVVTLQYLEAHGGGGGSGGGSNTTVSDTAPATPVYGDRWIKPSNMREMVWVPNAGTPGVWVDPADMSGGSGDSGGGGSVTYPITIDKGGTGAITASQALVNLGAVAKAGDTMTGNLVISTAQSEASLRLDSFGTGHASYVYGTNLGVLRWRMALGDTAAETGSNFGSNFNLYSYTDAGALLAIPLAFSRATGLGVVSGDPTTALGIATKQYVDGKAGGIADAPDATTYGRKLGAWVNLANHEKLSVSTNSSASLTSTTSSLYFSLNKPAGAFEAGIVGVRGGLNRWSVVLGNSAAEGGSNAGSDFALWRYNDAGTGIDAPISINRATGVVALTPTIVYGNLWTEPPTTPGNAYLTINKKGATGQYAFIRGTRDGSTRWQMHLGNATAESGSNAGSDFVIENFSDTNAYMGAALTLIRSSGDAYFGNNAFAKYIGVRNAGGTAILSLQKGNTTNTICLVEALGSNGAYRWQLQVANGQPETGSGNAGSDFGIYRYADNGAYLGGPLTINRADGRVYIESGMNITGSLTVAGAINVPAGGTNYATHLRAGANPVGAAMVFNWSGQPAGNPSWVWGGNDGTNMYVWNPANFTVALATNANNAYACSGLSNLTNNRQVLDIRNGANAIYIGWYNGYMDCQVDSTYFGGTWPIGISGTAAYANNSGGVGGCYGWAYRNDAKNPTYIWCTDGNTNAQYLTTPVSLSVGYANAAGNANSVGGGFTDGATYWGFASNRWQEPYMRCSNGAVYVALVRNKGVPSALLADTTNKSLNMYDTNDAFFGYMGYTASSDLRLKTNVEPSTYDALADVEAMDFIAFNYIAHEARKHDVNDRHELGWSAQNLQAINRRYAIVDPEGMLGPDANELLLAAMRSVQQLLQRVKALESK